MTRDHLLGLDLGTTRVCALVLGPDGALLGRAQRPLEARFPAPGRLEQDPAALWERSVETLRAALAAAGVSAGRVAGLGVASQRATVVAWRRDSGEPLAPAIGWQDRRGAARAAELRAAGVPASAFASATKLEWWLRHDPALQRAASEGTLRLGTPDVWLSARLSGGAAFVTDPSQASCTGLYLLGAADWEPAALQVYGIPREALPGIVASDAVVGETPAALLGAPVPLAARAGDQQAAAFAQGVRRPGDAKLTLGTSAMLDVHAGSVPPAGVPGAFGLALWRLGTEGDAFCHEGTVVTAGAAVDWLVELGLLPEAGALDAVAGSVPDSAGVAFVPALHGLGTPFLDEGARAAFGGLTRGSDAAHLVRAVLEGVAQRCGDVAEALGVSGALAVDGGLARSDLLCQTLADLSGRAVQRAAELETTALGAARLAGLGTGRLRDPADGLDALPQATPFAPRLPEAERRERRARWAEALAQLSLR